MGRSAVPDTGVYNTEEIAAMRDAIDAVCAELGITPTESIKRERVASCVMRSWADGARTPLNLVQAGLDSGA